MRRKSPISPCSGANRPRTIADTVNMSAGVRAHSIVALKYSRLVGLSRKFAIATAFADWPCWRYIVTRSSIDGISAISSLPSGCWINGVMVDESMWNLGV